MQNKTQSNFFMRTLKWRSNHCDLLKIRFSSGANLVLKVFVLCLSAIFTLIWCPLAEPQDSIHHPRIGFLSSGFSPPDSARLKDNLKAFHEGLRELGYNEGKNVFIEYRYGHLGHGHLGRSPEFAAELVGLKVKVIVAASTPAINAAKLTTSKIPIVMISGPDPVGEFINTLARPGGNITGVSSVASKLSGKLLELIIETVAEANKVGILWHPFTSSEALKEAEIAAHALKRKPQIVEVLFTDSRRDSRNDLNEGRWRAVFERASAMLARSEKRVGALVVLPAVLFARNERRIAELAVKNRLATIFHRSQFAEAGGLMAYGPRRSDLWRRAGVLVGKILQGAKPADLPVELPMKFELVINLKTAKALRLKIPAHLLMEADRVIE